MKIQLYPANVVNASKRKSLDELQIKLMEKSVIDMKNKYKENTKDYDYLSMNKEEHEVVNQELFRYKETLDMLENRIEELSKFTTKRKSSIEVVEDLKYFQGKTPVKIYIGNETFDVSNFAGVIVCLCEYLVNKTSKYEFEKVSKNIKGTKRNYFSENIESLYSGKEIKGTSIKVETNNSSDINLAICIELLEKMNFDKAFFIEIK